MVIKRYRNRLPNLLEIAIKSFEKRIENFVQFCNLPTLAGKHSTTVDRIQILTEIFIFITNYTKSKHCLHFFIGILMWTHTFYMA
jgi:hypothetical protein